MDDATQAKRRTRGGGPPNQIETHPQRVEIELALANGINLRKLAARFVVDKDALWRWKKRMTPERLALLRYRVGDSPIDLDHLKRGEAEAIIQRNLVKMADLQHLYDLAVEARDFTNALRAAREYRLFNEAQAKITGELQTGDRHLHMHVTDSPAYRRLVACIMAWAYDKPELAAELSEVLQENERAEQAALLEASPNGTDPHPA